MEFNPVGTKKMHSLSEVDQMTLTQSSLARVAVTAIHTCHRGRELLPPHPNTRPFSRFSPHIIQFANNGHSWPTVSRIAWVPR